jgi:hypothetical protein
MDIHLSLLARQPDIYTYMCMIMFIHVLWIQKIYKLSLQHTRVGQYHKYDNMHNTAETRICYMLEAAGYCCATNAAANTCKSSFTQYRTNILHNAVYIYMFFVSVFHLISMVCIIISDSPVSTC